MISQVQKATKYLLQDLNLSVESSVLSLTPGREDSEEENETTGRVTGQVESAGVGICAPSPKNDCLGFY